MKPLIILGAGASHDSINLNNIHYAHRALLEKYTPPLMHELFKQDREVCREQLSVYPEVESLASIILPRLADGELTFEKILQELLDRHNRNIANRDPQILKELISLNYYLADLFKVISNNYRDIVNNNYKILIRELQTSKIQACIINFNYDLIFENCLGMEVSSMGSYVSNDIKVIKIHGACNWVYEPVVFSVIENQYDHAQKYFSNYADTFFDNFNGKKIMIDNSTNYIKHAGKDFFDNPRYYAYMPAIALPLDKKSEFICPKDHLSHFEDNISSFDKLLIVGWRGTDKFIVEKLRENLDKSKKIRTLIVTGSKSYTSNNIKELKDKIRDQYSIIPQLEIRDEDIFLDGFSKFMGKKNNFGKFFNE